MSDVMEFKGKSAIEIGSKILLLSYELAALITNFYSCKSEVHQYTTNQYDNLC